MPKFLNTEELYRILQRELPEDVYPDGGPSAFFSTAENHSVANAASGLYATLEMVYNNFFPQSANEQIYDWEIKVFGTTLPATLSLADRRAQIIARLRSQISISMWDALTIVNSYVPQGVFTQVAEYGVNQELWQLNVSKLGFTTILGFGQAAKYFGDNACDLANADYLDPAQQANIIALRKQAYQYEVRIFGYTMPQADIDAMTADLYKYAPVRSDFLFRNNQTLATYFLNTPVTDVDRFSNVNCIARDSSSSTGYIGRIKTYA